MPQLAEILSETLDGAVTAIHRSERLHLLEHARMLERLKEETPGLEALRQALEAGYLPDFFAGTEVRITAQLALTTARERTLSAAGGVALGVLRLEGGLANTFRQGTQTNVAVEVTLVRQSRSSGLDYVLTSLRPLGVAKEGD